MADGTTFARAAQFIWANARLLERQRYARLFEAGPREPVLAALCAYQNVDGGFGNALEPDKRTPYSQPVDVQVALEVLDETGFDREVASLACDFLASISTEAGGVPFTLPSVAGFPHQPWWGTDAPQAAALNPTAAIAGLLHKHSVQHPWLTGATSFCWGAIAASPLTEPHELKCVLTFLAHVPDRAQAEPLLEHALGQIIAAGLVELDPHAGGYVQPPLDWAATPDAPARRLFSDQVIAAHLTALVARQQPDGGWPISWGPLSPGSELEWRGMVTLQALKTLRAYGQV